MAIRMSDNWMCAQPGEPAFAISNNFTDEFELGRKIGTDYWLYGQIVAGEFLFNGRLYLPEMRGAGTVIDNFPKGPAPAGWTKCQRVDEEGYDLKSDGAVLFGFRIVPLPIPGTNKKSRLCVVTVNIYSATGCVIAETLPDQLVICKGPARIGTHGIVIG